MLDTYLPLGRRHASVRVRAKGRPRVPKAPGQPLKVESSQMPGLEPLHDS